MHPQRTKSRRDGDETEESVGGRVGGGRRGEVLMSFWVREAEMLISVIPHLPEWPEFHLRLCLVCAHAASWTTTTSAASRMEPSERCETWKCCEYRCVESPTLTCGSAFYTHHSFTRSDVTFPKLCRFISHVHLGNKQSDSFMQTN